MGLPPVPLLPCSSRTCPSFVCWLRCQGTKERAASVVTGTARLKGATLWSREVLQNHRVHITVRPLSRKMMKDEAAPTSSCADLRFTLWGQCWRCLAAGGAARD